MKDRITNAKKEYDKNKNTKWRGAEAAFYPSDIYAVLTSAGGAPTRF